ncbi:hypothetical protein PYCCODRAFT_928755 [Trametes coccinea BRFM310]|uniref:Uncharacterized protein n=1 Tax=Trametes coccinea (strain BRFM310) TaxID=1353009 RepID=A0A1Y2IZ67_TRAC3|nr:hypothetical protein PYCCODRAFT_928755 [Trametes coccinea BRFM310]
MSLVAFYLWNYACLSAYCKNARSISAMPGLIVHCRLSNHHLDVRIRSGDIALPDHCVIDIQLTALGTIHLLLRPDVRDIPVSFAHTPSTALTINAYLTMAMTRRYYTLRTGASLHRRRWHRRLRKTHRRAACATIHTIRTNSGSRITDAESPTVNPESALRHTDCCSPIAACGSAEPVQPTGAHRGAPLLRSVNDSGMSVGALERLTGLEVGLHLSTLRDVRLRDVILISSMCLHGVHAPAAKLFASSKISPGDDPVEPPVHHPAQRPMHISPKCLDEHRCPEEDREDVSTETLPRGRISSSKQRHFPRRTSAPCSSGSMRRTSLRCGGGA